jgi:hypothetical protein
MATVERIEGWQSLDDNSDYQAGAEAVPGRHGPDGQRLSAACCPKVFNTEQMNQGVRVLPVRGRVLSVHGH